MSITGGILAGVGAASSIGSAAIGSNAAGNAAKTQAQAAEDAAQLQHQDAQASLAFQQQEYDTQQKNLAPFLSAGTGAVNQLSQLTSTPGQGLLTPFTEQFNAPTAATEQNDPGYQFRLDQGMNALQNSAAASGGLLSGGTGKALEDYAQGYASNEYSNVYNRAMQQYQQRYNIFEGNQSNTFNRYASLAGLGQNAATTLGQEGQAAAGNVANINLTSGAQIGGALQNAAAARASGYVGSANAYSGGLSNATGNLAQYMQYLAMNPSSTAPALSGVPQAGQLPPDSINAIFGGGG